MLYNIIPQRVPKECLGTLLTSPLTLRGCAALGFLVLGEAEFWRGARDAGNIWDMGGTSDFGILSGFPEHPAVPNTCAIALLASHSAIPLVFNAGVNSEYPPC